MTWRRASEVQVNTAGATDLQVDWLGVDPARGFDVTATRVFDSGGNVRLPVPQQDDRWLRFRRPGFSPVTVRATEVTADNWRLPVGQRGGEVVVSWPRGPINPKSVVLSGPERVILTGPAYGLVQRAGLARGNYRIFLDYAGGVRREAGELTVADGESTFVAPDQGVVGALQVEADAGGCRAALEVEVYRKRRTPERSGVSVESVERVPTDVELLDCRARIDGLSPGPYSVVISGQDGTVAETSVDVRANEVTDTSLHSSDVVLRGTITLNGIPLSGATVSAFGGTFQREYEARVVNGVVSLTLPRPGRYVLEISRGTTRMRGVQKTVDVATGTHDLQWEIRTGTVRVRVTGAAASAEPVSLYFRSRDGNVTPGQAVLTSFTQIVVGAVTTVDGIAPGAYSVHAAGETVASQIHDFQIREDGGTVDLTLDVTRPSMTMTVMDEFGTPIPGVMIRGFGDKAVETAPGQFTITGVAPGTPLPITAPGRVPGCRLATTTGHFDVRLSVGQSVTIELERRELLRAPLSVLSAGEACPVRFSWMSVTNLLDAPSGNPRVQISNMPLGATVVIQTPTGQQRLNVSSGFAIIR